jgi:hypothetical protein
MKTLPPAFWFFILLAAGVFALTLSFFPTVYWFFCLLLVALAGATLFLTRLWPDRAFYLTCACQPAVIACGATNIWTGLFVVWMLAGMVAGSMGLLRSRQDYFSLLLFCGLTFILSAVIQASNHVFYPVLAFGAAFALLTGIMAIRGYQFRKDYTGARL